MKNNRSIKRRGFTLVELLIVIVVIGVLSAMMMLSSTEAVSSAKASNIVSNLRNLKTAALAWYADHLDMVSNDKVDFSLATYASAIKTYMNNDDIDSGYEFVGTATDGTWYVKYTGADLSDNVKGKLAGRAKSVGLFNTNAADGKMTDSNRFSASATNGVFMYIR